MDLISQIINYKLWRRIAAFEEEIIITMWFLLLHDNRNYWKPRLRREDNEHALLFALGILVSILEKKVKFLSIYI